ncbi:hypothetical protein D3C78_1288750 [compost metagenome]
MVFQTHGLFDLIDVEGMFGHARRVRRSQAAAGGQNEFVVAANLLGTRRIDIADPFLFDVDGLCRALDEPDPYGIEQLANRRGQLVGVRLIEARAHTQLGLGSQHGHFNVVVAVNVEQARGTQSGPHATETCADYQNVLLHL